MDRVIFRKWKGKPKTIIAILPDEKGVNLGNTLMYEHIGQHGEGDYYGVISQTTLAKPDEYKDLLTELESVGYKLKVVKRWNQKRNSE